jgi:hypothetical protein
MSHSKHKKMAEIKAEIKAEINEESRLFCFGILDFKSPMLLVKERSVSS